MTWLLLAAGVSLLVADRLAGKFRVMRRLQPFVAHRFGDVGAVPLAAWLTAWTELFTPAEQVVGNVAHRLERAGLAMSVRQFRLLQQGAAGVGVVGVGVPTLVFSVPVTVAFGLCVLVAAALFFVSEQWVLKLSVRRRQTVARELPVVLEQLAGALQTGVGFAQACTDVATHTRGIVADDLRRIGRELAHGIRLEVALQSWAYRHDLPALHRIVTVLDTHRHAGELGTLLATEVRELRAAAHRALLATMQQREQQVWIPVTVATLVPGVLLLSVPFWHTLTAMLG